MKDKNTQSENKKSQAIYDSMPAEMKAKMDEKISILQEKAKTNPSITKMLYKK